MGWFVRRRYRHRVLYEALARRFDHWYIGLFQKRSLLEQYEIRIESLRARLERVVQMEVLVRHKVNSRVVELATDLDVIAKVTFYLRGTGFRKETSVLIRLNPRYTYCTIWFQAAFGGLRQNYKELRLELTKDMEMPRES